MSVLIKKNNAPGTEDLGAGGVLPEKCRRITMAVFPGTIEEYTGAGAPKGSLV